MPDTQKAVEAQRREIVATWPFTRLVAGDQQDRARGDVVEVTECTGVDV